MDSLSLGTFNDDATANGIDVAVLHVVVADVYVDSKSIKSLKEIKHEQN